VAACSGGEVLEPNESIQFLVGTWDAQRLVVESKANPEIAPEIIGLGGQFWLTVEPSGLYGATLVFEGASSTEMGRLEIDGDELVFHLSFPEETINRSQLTRLGSRIGLVGDTRFDFNLDGRPDPATARIELQKR